LHRFLAAAGVPGAVLSVVAAMALLSFAAKAQDNPKFVIDEDCQTFDISADHAIVYAVPRLKRVKRLVIERDDILIATDSGKTRKVVDADKFMPIPPPAGYTVDSLAWSPDGRRFAADLTLQQPPPGYEEQVAKDKKKEQERSRDAQDEALLASVGGGKAVALFDDDGHEIKAAGSKTRFIENATNGTWLADGSTVVYLTGGGPYSIMRVRPSDGQTTSLFEGHTFDAVIWDAPKNRAFAVGQNLSLRGRLTLVQLDLLHETVTEIARLENYKGALSLSPSGAKIAFFEDGDTIEVIDIANPSKPLRTRAGLGRFEWGRDERRVLLKRGPEDRSNDLVWVGLRDDSFVPALHDLAFRNFQIAPDGAFLAVTEPGKRALKVYPLE
jgi:dipeptidyl aminopeptidase/acylaminoacyl peptidase